MRAPAPASHLAALALVACAAGLGGCSPPEERAERAREAARGALEKGQRGTALQALKGLRESSPDTPEALIELTGLLVQAGEGAQAVWLLEDGLGRFPQRDDLRIMYARTSLLMNNAVQARDALQDLPASSEKHATAQVLLAAATLKLGDLEQGLAILDAAGARYPDRLDIRLARISTLLQERRTDEAKAALEEARARATEEDLRSLRQVEAALAGSEIRNAVAIRLREKGEKAEAALTTQREALQRLQALVDEDPGDVALWYALIEGNGRSGLRSKSSELLRKSLEEDPDRVALYSLLARVEAALGRGDEARAALEELILRSDSPTARLGVAQLEASLGNDDAAFAGYQAAIAAFPDEPMLGKIHAEALLDADRVEEARAEFEAFRTAEPDDPNVEYLRARLELTSGDAEAAAARLQRLVPNFDQAATQYWLGRALEASGDAIGAERRYRMAQTRGPSETAPRAAALRMAERRGDWVAVAKDAQRLALAQPTRVDGWVALLTALIELGENESAEKVAREALTTLPESPELHVLLARSLIAQSKTGEAAQEIDAAQEKLGAKDEFEAVRALALGIGGQLDEGIETARNALGEYPESARLQVTLAALLFERGDAEAGAAAVDRALELAPDEPSPLRLRAQFRAASRRYAGAVADTERYLQSRPDDPVMHFTLGAARHGAGDVEGAIAAYRRSAELDPRAFEARNNLAEILAERGDVEGALELAQQAFAVAEDNPYVLDTLGWLYLEKGLVDRSVSLLEDAHAGAPQHPVVQLHLALAYREAKRTDDARRLLVDLESRSQGDLHGQVEEALHSLE